MWKRVAFYGVFLAAGTFALQWLDYQRLARSNWGDIAIFLIAAAFLGLGVYIGARVITSPRPAPFDGNPKALVSLGISPRELTILHELAAGRSNKEIAANLNVSPNTVKTHVAKVYEKLDAKRRTDAIKKARELGIVP
ncbi:MAG: response regulator transcription factor [Rhizomicrobium sp.]|jgi:DNA-binding CsgD family transcriptional regulator